MNFLKHACLTLGLLFKQVCQLPQTIANFARQRQQQSMLTELEAERLDRIRHPEKYRGK